MKEFLATQFLPPSLPGLPDLSTSKQLRAGFLRWLLNFHSHLGTRVIHSSQSDTRISFNRDMAALGTALMSTLSHTDQEKMFRPWWDNLEDFVIYGLVSLGLIVLPTQIFQGTPLFCTICSTVIPIPITPTNTSLTTRKTSVE